MEIVDIFHDHIVAVPTNATRGHFMAPKLVGKVSFINVGLEGPRNTTNRVRGDYDKVMRGIMAFKEAGFPLSGWRRFEHVPGVFWLQVSVRDTGR